MGEGGLGGLIRRTFVESAQNLTSEKSLVSQSLTRNGHPSDHARWCLTLAFKSEYSCSAPLTPRLVVDMHVCFSIAVRLNQLKSSVSTCPFQTQHSIFETDELRPPANERPPFGEGKAGGHNGW